MDGFEIKSVRSVTGLWSRPVAIRIDVAVGGNSSGKKLIHVYADTRDEYTVLQLQPEFRRTSCCR